MKSKKRCLGIKGCVCALLLGLSAAAAFGAAVTWPGATLATDPIWSVENSLFSDVGDTTGNSLTLSSGGDIGGNVYGALSETVDLISNSMIVATQDTISGKVYAARSRHGLTQSNSITIQSGRFNSAVFGGRSGGKVQSNAILTQNGMFSADVYGGYSDTDSDADSNSVAISGGEFLTSVYGGYSKGVASSNDIALSAGNVQGSAYGGRGKTALKNQLALSGGAIKGDLYGGWGSENASKNSLTLSGGTPSASLYGGYSVSGTAENNTLSISGDIEVSGNVYGGYSQGGSAANNRIFLRGTPQLSGAFLHGGIGTPSVGNELLVFTPNCSVKGVDRFERYRFYPSEKMTSQDVMLAVIGSADLKGATVGIGPMNTAPLLVKGVRYPLISFSGAAYGEGARLDSSGNLGEYTGRYRLEYGLDHKKIYLVIGSETPLPPVNPIDPVDPTDPENPNGGTEVERILFDGVASHDEVILEHHLSGAATVRLQLHFNPNADPSQLESVSVQLQSLDMRNVTYAYVDFTGKENPLPEDRLISTRPPFLKVTGTLKEPASVTAGSIPLISYHLKGSKTRYVQHFNGGLAVKKMQLFETEEVSNDVPENETPAERGGGSGGCNALSHAALLLAGVPLLLKRR